VFAPHKLAEPAHQIGDSHIKDFHRLVVLFHIPGVFLLPELKSRQPFAMLSKRPALARFELRGHRNGVAQLAHKGILRS
jgi:hypothetical protein